MNAPIHSSNVQTTVRPKDIKSIRAASPRFLNSTTSMAPVAPSPLSSSTAGAVNRSHKPLHQSTPSLGNVPVFTPSTATSRSNPTMNNFNKGMPARSSRGIHHHFHTQHGRHQRNASFSNEMIPQRGQSECSLLPSSAKVLSRNSLVGLDKIIQRSSSKSVKQMLSHLEGLCERCHGAPGSDDVEAPLREVDMLLELASDVYYRVVIKKCQGVDIVTRLMQTFPELEKPCHRLLEALAQSNEGRRSSISPRSTRTTMLSDADNSNYSADATAGVESMDLDGPAGQSLRLMNRTNSFGRSSSLFDDCCETTQGVFSSSVSEEDIVNIINEGCQELFARNQF